MSGQLVVTGLGKAYQSWNSELRRVASWFSPDIHPTSERWVLRDVSFRVDGGEVVGIVGQNGAGKSTLLKLITGTAQPTTGSVRVTGRVAAILELGMGFNPEMTGRQNAAHAAGLMGMRQREIEQVMPDIEGFAELGDHFDDPLRTYSSGMQMRVAFGVATAFRPDLLIIDEALSVGDTYFQHKSFDRIRRFKEDGVSILFVTHGMSTVRALCDRVLLLDDGKLVRDGLPDEIVDFYNAIVAAKENEKLTVEQRRQKNGWLLTRSGSGAARIVAMRLLNDSGAEVAVAHVGERLTISIDARADDDLPRLVVGLMIRDKQGHIVWGTNTWHTQQVLEHVRRDTSLAVAISFTCTLGPGSYSITVALTSSESHMSDNFEWIDNLVVFDVVNVDRDYFVGSTWLDARFDLEGRA